MSRPMGRVRTTWALKCRRTRKEREIRLRILSTGFSIYYSTASLRAPLQIECIMYERHSAAADR
jgi:hypothetical protein